ncbi:MAG: Unknown protein [uncultured Sulfurovum sp.]|uniref:SPOR domain-containing protein n=1 Tax=uncultured Sulfurovum sp. TaxID=269237 RepID=A0A6S6RTC1_9BACT|nr:MAG: Unknown protein [uncultured Sulfurovum sp.]
MKSINIFMATSAVAFLATGCVKPITTQETQPVYTNNTTTAQPAIYETAQPIVYEGAGVSSGTIYETAPMDSTVITTSGVGSTTYPDPYATTGTTVSNSYPDPYATSGTTVTNAYPDPYAAGTQSTVSNYPVSNYPTTTSQAGGIHLQIAALKDYSTAEDYKNRLSLAPGLSAYVQRGNVNKVIVAGIPSVAEANRLKESRFPGAFIVQGGSMGGYTPTVQPNYDTSSNVYNVNNPYGNNTSSANSISGIGVQVGAFGSQGKAQSVANSQGAQYPAIVKRIGQYYKVILTGFSSRSAAKSHAGRVNGFVVNY